MNRWKQLRERYDRFLFERASPRRAAWVRIGVGTMSVWILSVFLIRFDGWLGPNGWLNSTCLRIYDVTGLNLISGVAARTPLLLFTWMSLMASVFLLFGFFSRTAALLAFLGMTSLQGRINCLLCGGDVVIQFLLFFLVFADSGKALSIDAWIRRKRGVPLPPSISIWPLRLIQIQFSVIYLTAVMHKLKDDCWTNGLALYYGLRYREFFNFPSPAWTHSMFMTTSLTYLTLVVELSLGLILFLPRFRRPLLLIGIGLHLGIAYMMFIPNFAPVMVVGYCAFLTDEDESDLKRLWARLKISAKDQTKGWIRGFRKVRNVPAL